MKEAPTMVEEIEQQRTRRILQEGRNPRSDMDTKSQLLLRGNQSLRESVTS